MPTVNVTVALGTASLPAGTPEVDKIRVQILDGATIVQNQHVAPTAPIVASFSGVAPGTYTVRAVAIAANTNEMGAAVTNTFTVESDVMRSVPVSVSVG